MRQKRPASDPSSSVCAGFRADFADVCAAFLGGTGGQKTEDLPSSRHGSQSHSVAVAIWILERSGCTCLVNEVTTPPIY